MAALEQTQLSALLEQAVKQAQSDRNLLFIYQNHLITATFQQMKIY